MIVVDLIQIVLFVYLGLATLYVFMFGFASIFPKPNKKITKSETRKFAVLIPGYKEDNVILEVAEEAIKQDYPVDMYDVVIIADSFKQQTLDALKKLPIKLVEVSFELSTKSKALNWAMDEIGDDYDVALVLDADNIMEPSFISKINNSFNKGFTAVQGHRVAKNLNTHFAILDAISEEVNNKIFRKGHRVLRLSAALIGSGMAMEYSYFKSMMKSIKAIGGFDKEIELKMLKERKTIEYLEEAIVYDEKVQKAEVFTKQRRRWLSAQLHYFTKDILTSLKHFILKGNVDYFDKAIQFIQPPRVMLLGLLVLINIASILFNTTDWMYYWIYLLIACIITFTITIPLKFYNLKTLKAVLTLPKAFFLIFLSLLRLKGANKKFIHTEHGTSNNS